MTTIKLDGGKALQDALREMSDDLATALDMVVIETAAEIEGDIKLRIQQGPKTGRVYRRGNVTHQASAPGESPASDTGGLIGSIQHERDGKLAASVLSRLDEATYLEFGTQRIAPRPAWVPVVEQAAPQYQSDIQSAIVRTMK